MEACDEPVTLHLPSSLLTQGFDLARLMSADPRWSWAEGFRLLERFDLHERERAFCRTLWQRHTQLWIFRANQRAFCGDFVLVDMSMPQPARRRAYVVELKAGARLAVDDEGSRHQLAQHSRALAELVAAGVLGPASRIHFLWGDPAEVVGFLQAPVLEAAS